MVKDPFDVALAEFERWTATTQRQLSADPVGELETLLQLSCTRWQRTASTWTTRRPWIAG